MSVRDWFIAPPPHPSEAAAWAPPVDAALAVVDAASPHDASVSRALTSAAVIGRPGKAEPVAAGLALAIRGRAPAAAVIVVGEPQVPSADGGTRAARRLSARLAAHGFGVAGRGRLAWAYVTPDVAQRAVRMAGEPVVLAITSPLDAALEVAIADHGLAIVVACDEHGPLAELATASLARPGLEIATVAPLRRGLGRVLAHHGLRAPPALRASITRK
jgi:hypothetical protein